MEMKKKRILLILITVILLLCICGGFLYFVRYEPYIPYENLVPPNTGTVTVCTNADGAVVNLSDKDEVLKYSFVVTGYWASKSIMWSCRERLPDLAYLSVTKDGYIPLKLNIDRVGFKPSGSHGKASTVNYYITMVPVSGNNAAVPLDNMSQTVIPWSPSDTMAAGFTQVFCNVDGAAAGVICSSASSYQLYISEVVNGTALIPIYYDIASYSTEIDLFVSADGYDTETIANVTCPAKGEIVTYSVNLTPLSQNANYSEDDIL